MSNKKKEHIPLDRKKVDVMYNNYMELNKLHWVNIRGGSFYIHPIVEGEDMEYVTTEMFKKLTDNFDSFVKSLTKINNNSTKNNNNSTKNKEYSIIKSLNSCNVRMTLKRKLLKDSIILIID